MSEVTGPRDPDDAFLARLGEFVLLSYASGQPVEGEWSFVSGRRLVPDVTVSITRTDGGGRGLVQDPAFEGTDTRPFEVKLEAFLLTEYSEGERIAGTWELQYAREALPTWLVDIDLDEAVADADPDEFTAQKSTRG